MTTQEEQGDVCGGQGSTTRQPNDETTERQEGRQARGGWVLGEALDVGIALRSGRRRLGCNQRELARRAGISQATVARLEAGGEARFGVVVAALAACGLLVVAVPPDGAPDDWTVHPHPSDEGRDTGGRRLPAHLPAYPTDYVPMYTLWKRLMRGESLFAERPSHWIYTREEWAMPPSPPRDRDASPPPRRPGSAGRPSEMRYRGRSRQPPPTTPAP
jgi:transcriptional regulator with XRE-family HTH domain